MKQEKFMIAQWGKERSILISTTTTKRFIINNQKLMNLDEMGLIIS